MLQPSSPIAPPSTASPPGLDPAIAAHVAAAVQSAAAGSGSAAMLYCQAFFSRRSTLKNDSLVGFLSGTRLLACIRSLQNKFGCNISMLARSQAMALASLYMAAKIVELADFGVPGCPEEPFPDLDRGSASALARSAMRWMYHQHSKTNSNGRTNSHTPVRCLALLDLLSDAGCMWFPSIRHAAFSKRDEQVLLEVVFTAELTIPTEMGFFFLEFLLRG
jgi:hypothetical protein